MPPESPFSYNRVEIDLAVLRSNYRCLAARLADGTGIMAIVKADAYGHGLLPVSRCLEMEGAAALGVAEVDEGVALRDGGIALPIIVLMGGGSGSFQKIIDYRLSPVVFDRDIVKLLSDYALERGVVVPVQLKVDTGMGRLGIMPEELDEYLSLIGRAAGLALAGILSHFPLADSIDQEPTRRQEVLFSELAEQCFPATVEPGMVHIANSAAVVNFPDSHHNMVRPGIALYGCTPLLGRGPAELGLKPVMSFKTRVIQVKEVPAGYGISYGHLHKTERPTRLAVLPVGYDDGYLRRLTGRAEVIIHGRRVPVVGRICMNACLADVSSLEGVLAGDEVVLMGRQQGVVISAEELAGWQETINYEVLCLFGGRNRRIYLGE